MIEGEVRLPAIERRVRYRYIRLGIQCFCKSYYSYYFIYDWELELMSKLYSLQSQYNCFNSFNFLVLIAVTTHWELCKEFYKFFLNNFLERLGKVRHRKSLMGQIMKMTHITSVKFVDPSCLVCSFHYSWSSMPF